MCHNMSFLKICSLATLVAIFSFLTYILRYWVQTKSMFYRWLNLGASPFLLIADWNFYFTILKFNSEISTLYQASAVRNDVRGRRLSRPEIERGLGRPCTATLKFPRTSSDKEQDGDDHVREWRFLRIFWLEFSGLGRGHRRHPHPQTSKNLQQFLSWTSSSPSYSWPRKSSTSDVVPYCGGLI